MRVLLVEDERRLADNIARTLRESAGYAVDVATDGAQGLYLAESSPYDLVVLDLMLPKLDGHSSKIGGTESPVCNQTCLSEQTNPLDGPGWE